ncbi:hypothetical protein [Streptomyces sp. NPDC053560]|uniref:hypothetical protein n=1 Tax=Streptomyces sp. NPDC053560 TaxID=3365711 RepID=UPI0037D835FE
MLGLIILLFALAAVLAVLGLVNPERLSRTQDGGTSNFGRGFVWAVAAIAVYAACSLLQVL